MQFGQPAIRIISFLSIGFTYASINGWDACGARLERALEALHRDFAKRNKLQEKESGTLYQRRLRSAPLEMSVSGMAVKFAEKTKEPAGEEWARVERCVYEPDSNSLRTRVVLKDLSVRGTVSLTRPTGHGVPRGSSPAPSVSAHRQSCRMILRLRQAEMDFITSPIARAHGRMRIRTESSFLEPKFASIYAYGCRLSARIDKQIKRQDKWSPLYRPTGGKAPTTTLPTGDHEYDPTEMEPRHLVAHTEQLTSHHRLPEYSVWRENSWITKAPRQTRSSTMSLETRGDNDDHDDSLVNFFSTNAEEEANGSWRSKERVTREMEDMFLRSASEALTTYIERHLHPAIKETLMLSMGYTISYG